MIAVDGRRIDVRPLMVRESTNAHRSIPNRRDGRSSVLVAANYAYSFVRRMTRPL
jgi:hypothetical protein